MPAGSCIDCGQPCLPRYQRCPTHTALHRRQQAKARSREAARARAVVAAWRAEHGNWCPGWQRPPHEATDLTAQHEAPFILTGGGGPLTVLCRSCNTREGNTRKGAPTEWDW